MQSSFPSNSLKERPIMLLFPSSIRVDCQHTWSQSDRLGIPRLDSHRTTTCISPQTSMNYQYIFIILSSYTLLNPRTIILWKGPVLTEENFVFSVHQSLILIWKCTSGGLLSRPFIILHIITSFECIYHCWNFLTIREDLQVTSHSS